MLNEELRKQLSDLVTSKKVVLFMKGNRHFPQCGFSAQVVGILNELLPSYETVNVLSDTAVREGIKEFSNWPTIPQLYVNGQFVGGCDIVKDLHASGELRKLVGAAEMPAPVAPKITITEAAARAFTAAEKSTGEDRLCLTVSPSFEYELYFDAAAKHAGDVEVESGGMRVSVDAAACARANGLVIDYVQTADGGAFKITNPNEPARVLPLSPRELKAMLDRGEKLELFDVRTSEERNVAKIDRARHLDAGGETYLHALDHATPIVFHCHHGGRSRAAAERFLKEGFKKIYNLEGGIEAWSTTVDSSVPRY